MKKKNQKEDYINNWTIYGIYSVMIHIFNNKTEDNEVFQGGFSFFLDDGEEDSFEKNITILTDIYSDDLGECVAETFNSLILAFDNIIDTLIVFDDEMNTKEYPLEYFIENSEKHTIH